MYKYRCILSTEGVNGFENHAIEIEADTKTEAGEIAFSHYMELADEAVTLTAENPTPLILCNVKITRARAAL